MILGVLSTSCEQRGGPIGQPCSLHLPHTPVLLALLETRVQAGSHNYPGPDRPDSPGVPKERIRLIGTRDWVQGQLYLGMARGPLRRGQNPLIPAAPSSVLGPLVWVSSPFCPRTDKSGSMHSLSVGLSRRVSALCGQGHHLRGTHTHPSQPPGDQWEVEQNLPGV